MNILSIPYFAGGLSHLLPLYVLHKKFLKNPIIENEFLVSNNLKLFLKFKGVNSVPIDFFGGDNHPLIKSNNNSEIIKYVLEKQKEAYAKIKPTLVLEDGSLISPLIAEKNNIPRISIQRTGMFRSIDNHYRNKNHVHSMQKGVTNNKKSIFNDYDNFLLQQYIKPKVKIIPGIPTIECLPNDIEDKESYFFSGPLIIEDKPSKNLSIRLDEFLKFNKQKPIVFITTGTVDKTPIDKFIEFFINRNYAIITTCNYEINKKYKNEVFYNHILPLHHISKISDLMIHQCGSGMYHYPIMNRIPSLTIGTQCYDREDIAQRLQKLGVSGHIPHPDDNSDYWNIFIELINKFEKNTLTDYKMIDRLKNEIDNTIANFRMKEVIKYALA